MNFPHTPFTLAVASGKGGTGKTTVSLNLALSAKSPVTLLDCDVEEPNCHLFLSPSASYSRPITVPVPTIDASKCIACGACARICQFNAIVSVKTGPVFFSELCHSCGGCALVCPTKAIEETDEKIGSVELADRGGLRFGQGSLEVGNPLAPTVINAVKELADPTMVTVIDCPPGTACPMVAALRGADFVLLVTEPTPFGLHDLTLAVDTAIALGLPFGVVVNRAGSGDDRVRDYCNAQRIPLLLEIPEDRKVAEAYSRGEAMVEAIPHYRKVFEELWSRIAEEWGRAKR
jgi:MinD superfamily P-loop ATPase